MSVLIGIDIGGTFTDLVSLETSSGKFSVTKVPSTPEDFSQGFFNGLRKILELCGANSDDVMRLVHGTTVATNAILEHKGAKIGILITKGFRDTLIMGRGIRRELYNIFLDSETPLFLCPRERMMEINERLDSKGQVLNDLDEDDVIKATDFLVKNHGVQAIAVCYLFSFLNPAHEERTQQIIQELYPNVRVSISSRVNPRFREYERLGVTAFDAYVGPAMESYVRKLNDGITERGIDVVLQVMQSRGGITSAEMCAEKPVLTLLSGLSAGAIGGRMLARQTGRENMITLDMGGTSNDVALIRHGKTTLFLEGKIGPYPCRQAMMDVSTIGAGGGSIAWLDSGGWLKVGPQSAGALPGPVCYCRGGKEPTYTDATLVLGYLRPDFFAGGEVMLDLEPAKKAIEQRVAQKLGIDVVKAAAEIHRVLHNKMADQLRLASVYRGYDPRQFSLVAFGGAGPVAAGRLLQILGFKEAVIPRTPGVMSALGLLAADIEHEEVVTLLADADKVNPNDVKKVLKKGEALCEKKRKGVGISETLLRVDYLAEMRYVGQSWELEVPFPEGAGEITEKEIQKVVERFHEVHRRVYHHAHPRLPVEFTAFRVLFSQESVPAPVLERLMPGTQAEPVRWREAYFGEGGGWVKSSVYERGAIVAGQEIEGPAIVDQADSTTVIYPSQRAVADEWGNLVISQHI